MTPIDIDALEALEKKATKGPWRDTSGKGTGVVSAPACAVYLNVRTVEDELCVKRWQADAALISTLRNAAPALFAELRELRAKHEGAQSELGKQDAELTILAAHKRNAESQRDTLRAEVETLRMLQPPVGSITIPPGVLGPIASELHRVTKERDEARAQLAKAHDEAICSAIRVVQPSESDCPRCTASNDLSGLCESCRCRVEMCVAIRRVCAS